MAMSRRKFLLAGGLGVVVAGAGAVAAVEARILPGRSTLNKALGLTGGPVGLPQVEPATVESGSYTSALRLGETTNWRLAYPAGMSPEGLPLVVSLHGRGGTAAGSFSDGIGLQYFLADSVERGNVPFAIASIDGGEGYWHARADGSDTGAMITEELLPILAKKGIDVSSLSLFGWSMGGFGAILQGQLSSVPVTAVASSGAALWPEFARTAEGAFDDEADFLAHGLMPTVASSVEVPTRMACGFDDGFIHNNQQYAEELPYLVQTQFEAGLHDDDFWRRMMPGQLDFLAQHIASR